MYRVINNQFAKTTFAIIAATLVSTGCIDLTSDDDHKIGKFIDSPVIGLDYQTDTRDGRTNIGGEFKYHDEETIVFSIGDIELPSTMARPIVTPLNIADSNDPENPMVVNILRLLQTLDDDSDPENGIEISQRTHEAAEGVNLDFSSEDFATANSTLEFIYQAKGDNIQLVEAEAAVAHFTNTLNLSDERPELEFSAKTLEQQTFYIVSDTEDSVSRSAAYFDQLYFDQGELSFRKDGEEISGQYRIENGILRLSLDQKTDDIYIAIVSEELNHLVTCWAGSPLGSLLCERDEDFVRLFHSAESASDYLNQDAEPDLGAATGTPDSEYTGSGEDKGQAGGDSSDTDAGEGDTGDAESEGTSSGSTDSNNQETESNTDESNSTGGGTSGGSAQKPDSEDKNTSESAEENNDENPASGGTDSQETASGGTPDSTDNGDNSTQSGSDNDNKESGDTSEPDEVKPQTTDSTSGNSGGSTKQEGGAEPDTGAATGSQVNGTKFNPGNYVFMSISRRYSKDERARRRIEFVKRYINNPNLKGFIGTYDWRYLEPSKDNYDFSNIREILKLLKGSGKHFGIYLKDRKFSSSCTKPPVPDYLLSSQYGGAYKYAGYVCMVKLYRQDVMDRQIALFKALGREFDDHPNFELISTGETSIGGDSGYSADLWTNQLIRLFKESKKELKHTLIDIQMNFLGGGSSYMERIAKAMAETGGGALGLPDTVPCRRTDIPANQVCGYTIPSYEILRKYNGVLAITPDVETWDLIYEQTPEVYDMAVDYLGATHILWQSEFSSRRDSRGYVPNYLNNQVLPTIASQGGRINTACPSKLAPCYSSN